MLILTENDRDILINTGEATLSAEPINMEPGWLLFR